RGHLHLHAPELRLRLLVLQLGALEVRLRRARAQRIVDLEADAPERIAAAKDVAQRRAETALGDDLPCGQRGRIEDVHRLQLHAAHAGRLIIDLRVDVGQNLVAEVANRYVDLLV